MTRNDISIKSIFIFIIYALMRSIMYCHSRHYFSMKNDSSVLFVFILNESESACFLSAVVAN